MTEISLNNLQTQINSKANGTHTHTKVEITDFPTNIDTATKLQTARTITLIGGVTGSTTFDGSANASITTTLTPHTHTKSQITDFTHTHTMSDISDLPNLCPFIISATAPTNTSKLWIDNNGVAYFHNGTAWISIKGTYLA